MKLTGKCKQDFEEWFWVEQPYLKKELKDNFVFTEDLQVFYNETPSMQYGVIVDFFDSVNICINNWGNVNGYFADVNDEITYKGKGIIKGLLTRHEARLQAIEKANEIYNKQ